MFRAGSGRRERTRFTAAQRATLEEIFTNGNKYPSPEVQKKIASKLGLKEHAVKNWFQNRRQKENKCNKEQDRGSKESTTTDSKLKKTSNDTGIEIANQDGDSTTSCSDIKIQPHTSTHTPCSAQGTEVKLPHTEATNCGDLGGMSHHIDTGDTRNLLQGNATSYTKKQSNIPSCIVSSLPDGTIAVKSTEQYHREIEETQKHQNIGSDVKLLHLTNNPAEISAPQPVAVNVCNPNPKPPYIETQRNTAEDTNPSQSPNISINAPTEIKVPHPEVPQVQLTSSCLDEKPKKRVISETTSSDEKPVMATHVSSNDVVKKGNDKKSDSVGDAEFTFQNKKVKTGDMVDTCTVTAPCNTSPECRIFGET